MKHRTLFAGLTITLLATACGGAATPSPRSAGSSAAADAAEPATAEPAGAIDTEDSGPPMPAPAARESAAGADVIPGAGASAPRERKALEQEAARDRPGLATQWGETRVSRITTAPFIRADRRNPSAIGKVFYNDRAGARAMARRRGFASLDSAEFSVARGALTVSLLDASGSPLPAFRAGSRNFAVGEAGQRYVIHLANHTGARIEAVATVDGLDVIDGQDGSFSKRGYILDPYSTVEIDGFRRSYDTVAAFRFGSVQDSYAAKKGKARNVGVIGVAFFHERSSRWPWDGLEIERRESADPFPARFSEPPPRPYDY